MEDITERKAAVDALAESEEKFRVLSDQSLMGIHIIQGGVFKYVNQATSDICGYSIEEIMRWETDEYAKVIHPDDRPLVLEQARRKQAGEMDTTSTYEWRLVTRSGEMKWIQSYSRTIPYGEGLADFVMMTDMTERKQAEDALRESLERESVLGDFIRQSTVAVGLGYPDGSIGFVNPAFRKLTGYTEEELKTIDWNETLTPVELREYESAKLDELLRTRRAVNYEKEYIRKDGSRVPIELFVHPRFDHEGRLSHYISFINDITERKQAEEQLRMASDEWQETFDAAEEMIMLLDADFRIIKANKATADFFASPLEEIVGKPCYQLMHGAEEPPPECPFARMLQTRKHEEAEMYMEDRDIWASVAVDPILDADGNIVRTVHIVRDITERKRTMERLERLNLCFLSLGVDPRENVEKILRAGRDILDAHLLKYCCPGRRTQYLCLKTGISSTPLEPEAEGCGFLAAPPQEGPVFVRDLTLSPPANRHPDVARLGLRSLLSVAVKAEQDLLGSLCLFSATERAFTTEERELLMMLARAIAIEEERFRHEESLRDFIDIASHELRHPITIMKGYSLILKERGEKLDEGTREVILDIIDHGADRLDNLVGGLLDISRIERGKFEVRPEAQSVVPLIERAIQEMGARGFSNDFTRGVSGKLGKCTRGRREVRRTDGAAAGERGEILSPGLSHRGGSGGNGRRRTGLGVRPGHGNRGEGPGARLRQVLPGGGGHAPLHPGYGHGAVYRPKYRRGARRPHLVRATGGRRKRLPLHDSRGNAGGDGKRGIKWRILKRRAPSPSWASGPQPGAWRPSLNC